MGDVAATIKVNVTSLLRVNIGDPFAQSNGSAELRSPTVGDNARSISDRV